MKVDEFLDAIHRLRTGLRHPRIVADEHLKSWIEVANRHQDFWLRYQIASILSELYPGDPTWGVVVLNWIRDALQQHSAWAEELIVLGLRSWPELLEPTPVLFSFADHHPQGLARGILEAVRRKALHGPDLPPSWREGLARLRQRVPEQLGRELAALLDQVWDRRVDPAFAVSPPVPPPNPVQVA